MLWRVFVLLCLCVGFWAACEPAAQWVGPTCQALSSLPERRPALWQLLQQKGTVEACLVSTDTANQRTTQLVSLTQKGQLLPFVSGDTASEPTLAKSVQGQPGWTFTLLFLSESAQSLPLAEKKSLCLVDMAGADFDCVDPKGCWFSETLSTQSLPEQPGVCQVTFVGGERVRGEPASEPTQEPVREPTQEPTPDAAPRDERVPEPPMIPEEPMMEPTQEIAKEAPKEAPPEASSGWVWPPPCPHQFGCVVTIAGNGKLEVLPGNKGYVHKDGPAKEVPMLKPSGLALENDRFLYIADPLHFVVRKLDLTTGIMTTVAGIPNTPGDVDGPYGTNTLTSPTWLQFDPQGRLLIATRDHLRRLLPNGNVETVATLSPWSYTLSRPAVTATGEIFVPVILRQSIFAVSGTSLVSQVGSGISGAFDLAGRKARFSYPESIIYDATNKRLIVADSLNHKLRAVALASFTASTITGTPNSASQPGNSDGTLERARINYPIDLGLHSNGDIYFLTKGNVQIGEQTLRVIAKGLVTTLAGTGKPVSKLQDVKDGDARLTATFYEPRGLALFKTRKGSSTGHPYALISDGLYIRLFIPK